MSPNPQSRYTARAGVEYSLVDGGAVLVDKSSGDCFELNRVGTEVWQLIVAGKTVAEVSDDIHRRYPEADHPVEDDVCDLVRSLLERRLLEAVGETQ